MGLKKYSCEQIHEASDLATAIDVDKVFNVRLDCSPKGQGKALEVAGSNSNYYFKKEHNIVWIKFRAVRDSKLNIIIKPDSASDDYDYQIYKDEGASTRQSIISKRQKPIRSNLARTKDVNGGITGLDYFTDGTHVSEGVNPGYCKYMQVVEDEVYYLVIDNVYANGGGALIEFDYFLRKKIKGSVLDDEGKILAVDVVWENGTSGKELNRTESDSVTGEFEMYILYYPDPEISYTLSVEADGHIFEEKKFLLSQISQLKATPIKLILPKLEKGKRTRLNNINFEGGQDVLLKGAYPSLRRLARLMIKNPTLKIHIEGHTNGCPSGDPDSQTLSEERAERVRSFLKEKGVDSSRITTEGLNCSKMLYPLSSSEEFQSLNRRVEIVVIDY
jgi:outer membrane protein OmpA-like peptidoglycan-associated protein